MAELDGDRGRTILAMIIARLWRDPSFKAQFLQDPKAVFKDEGVDLPGNVTIQIVEDTSTAKYIPLPRQVEISQDTMKIASLVAKLLPIPAGRELRFVQSTDATRYVVIPLPPAGDVGSMADAHLMSFAADSGVEATYHDTSQSVEAETTEVTVTETTEAQDAETTTTVVAEAELVAT